jgi:hypothetical protein
LSCDAHVCGESLFAVKAPSCRAVDTVSALVFQQAQYCSKALGPQKEVVEPDVYIGSPALLVDCAELCHGVLRRVLCSAVLCIMSCAVLCRAVLCCAEQVLSDISGLTSALSDDSAVDLWGKVGTAHLASLTAEAVRM